MSRTKKTSQPAQKMRFLVDYNTLRQVRRCDRQLRMLEDEIHAKRRRLRVIIRELNLAFSSKRIVEVEL